MIIKFLAGAALTSAVVIGGTGAASADVTPYDSPSGPWPTEGACTTAADLLNSNGRNPHTPCHEVKRADGGTEWWFQYAVVVD